MLDTHNPVFWVTISFVLFMALLAYYKVPGLIAQALDARAARIKLELDEARRLRDDAQALLADYKRKAGEAEREAEAIVEQARREAESLAEQTAKALEESLARRTKLAEDKIARAEAQAVAEVRSAAVSAAVGAAETILKGKSGQLGTNLIDDSIRTLGSKLN